MKNFQSTVFLVLPLFFLILFSSCVSPKKDVIQQSLEAPRQQFSQGYLQKAIDGYTAALQKYPDVTIVIKDYIQTLEEIKTSADNAYEAKNYVSAEQRYSILLNNFSRFKTFENSLSFTPKHLSRRIKECFMARSKIQAYNAIKSGDYTKALEIHKLAIQAFPEDPPLKESLIETINEIHGEGEKALEREDYVQTGKRYALLLKEHHWLKNMDAPLPFSKNTLEEGIKHCRTLLTRKGLEHYREGKLKEAISVWKGILEFDPENEEIKKAIENAEEQLKKIKK
jgi:tetratricopeptide (TPR) repeat protein